jgi:hypothetical protein
MSLITYNLLPTSDYNRLIPNQAISKYRSYNIPYKATIILKRHPRVTAQIASEVTKQLERSNVADLFTSLQSDRVKFYLQISSLDMTSHLG